MMTMLLFASILLFLSRFHYSSSAYTSTSLSKYDHFVKHPMAAAMIKTGGRLSERQINYVAEAGYAAILSVSDFPTDDTSYMNVSDSFPSSVSEISMGKSLGLEVAVVNAQLTPQYVKLVSDMLTGLPKPVYVHCHVMYTRSINYSDQHILHVN